MYLKAVYSVEAAVVIGICMIVIGMVIMLSFTIYHQAFSFLVDITPKEMDVVEVFRQIKFGNDVLSGIFG